jgi:two-component system response regulator PilR (NtrC family)
MPIETTAPAQHGRILIVDDEPVVADVLGTLLRKEGHEVHAVSDAAGGRARIEEDGPFEAILLDVMLTDADGLEVLRWIRSRDPDVAVLMITAFGTVENAVLAMKLGAFHYLTKPFKNEEVRLLVAQAVGTTRLRTENKGLKKALEERYRFEKIVGKSRAMQEVYRLIDQVAQSRATVLIQGESGTGKELVAQAIHRRSSRLDKPFVVVNSHSIPTDLLEDNLFGHAKGAFTGAGAAKIGLLEVAEGGTVLFDEISTVAPTVQTKLLRVMQDREFLPLGALESRTVDVRILAATNEDLRKLIEIGRFRDDLYYRLNVINISIPPLRERMEDIPVLVEHFLAKYNAENGKDVKRLSPEVIERFLSYTWPGNVRELENVIERGVVLARGDEIDINLLPREMSQHVAVPGPAVLPEDMPFYDAVSGYERRLIEGALRRSGGVQKQAAELLGLKPTTLNEKIKRLGIVV